MQSGLLGDKRNKDSINEVESSFEEQENEIVKVFTSPNKSQDKSTTRAKGRDEHHEYLLSIIDDILKAKKDDED